MTNSLLTPPTDRPLRSASVPTTKKSVSEIISAARRKPVSLIGPWQVAAVTGVLLWGAFTPLDFGFIAWFALVPLLLMVRMPRPTKWMYLAAAVGGWIFWIPALQWMRLGDSRMYFAWAALGTYLGFYFPVFVALTRAACHRKVPLIIAAPVVWTALELVRSHLMTGFGWYMLGHTQYRWVEFIQIADLVGVYGISFVVMAGNAALAELVPIAWFERLKLVAPASEYDSQSAESRLASSTTQGKTEREMLLLPEIYHARVWGSVLWAFVLLNATLVYGYMRRGEAKFTPGPRVALIQGNFASEVKHNPDRAKDIISKHHELTGWSVKEQPDLIVWPETMFIEPIRIVEPGMTDQQLKDLIPGAKAEWWRDTKVGTALTDLSAMTRAGLLLGVMALEAHPDRFDARNSVVFVTPDGGIAGRYDKKHLVPFGEYIPLKKTIPLLSVLSPFGSSGITPGESVHVFQHQKWNLLPLICFEDTVAHEVRDAVAAQGFKHRIDCLVNVTNDGWFKGSSELDQHLITAQFRCVETRVPMVRAVNTGISAIIDGDGVVRDPQVMWDGDQLPTDSAGKPTSLSFRDPLTGRPRKSRSLILVSDVPLDSRSSFYVIHGDWFAALCLGFSALFGLCGLLPSRGNHGSPASSSPDSSLPSGSSA